MKRHANSLEQGSPELRAAGWMPECVAPLPDYLQPRGADGRLIRPKLLLSAIACLLPVTALAGPKGGQVVAGDASISNPRANKTVIRQSTDKSIIDWQSFSIGKAHHVKFRQPGKTSISLNRVVGGDPSSILGKLSSNGQVYLVNPNGIYFGQGAQVDVSGIVASVFDIGNSDFMSGNFVFENDTGAELGKVINDGIINARKQGYVVLMGDYVENSGVIEARMGKVVLASGSRVTMDISGNNLISVAVDAGTVSELAGVKNSGEIYADGGRVIMTAKVADDLIGSAVNNTGLVRANSIVEKDGAIFLTGIGGDVTNSGTLDASAAAGSKTDGGGVLVYSDRDITLSSGAAIKARGDGRRQLGGTVRVIAEEVLEIESGAEISVAGGRRRGGFVEISGHGGLKQRGEIDVGSAGTLVIDPSTFTINAGTSGPTGTANGNVGSVFLSNQLNAGNNVFLVADTLITASAPLTISATNTGAGDLNLVIGTLSAGGTLGGPSNSAQCNSAGYCLGNSAGVGNFTVNPDPNGSIALGNVNFRLDGGLNIAGGSTAGNVSVGGINADGNVSIQAAGDVSLQGYVADAGSDFSVNAGRDIQVNDDMGSTEGNYRATTNFSAGRHIVINKDIYSGNNDINLNADTDGDNIGNVVINGSTSGRHTILTGGDLNISGQDFNVNGADFGTVGTLADQRAQVSVKADRIIVNINGDMTLQAGRIDLEVNLGTSGAGGTNASVDTSVTVSATRLVDITANNLSVRGGTAAASVSGTSYTSSVRALANAELAATGGNMNINLAGSLDLQAGVATASLFDRSSSDIAVAEANASIKASGAIDIVAATGVAVNAGSVLANAQGIVNGGSPVKARANATIDAGANLDLAVANGNLQIVGGTATAGATGTGGNRHAADASARAQVNAGNNTRISITNGNLSVQAGTATASLSGSIAVGDAGANADAEISADKNISADVSNMITVTGGTALVNGDWTSATTMSAEADANALIDAGANLILNAVGGLNVVGGGANATPSTSTVTTGSLRGTPAARPTNGAASAFAIGELKAGDKAVVNVTSGSLTLTGGTANPTSGSISTGSGGLTVFMTYAHASVKANTLKMMANTDITGSNAKIRAKGVYLGAGNNINLMNTLTTVGNGAAPGVKGDPLLFNVMNAAGIGLPNNTSPNLFMDAGNSMFTGDVRSTASNSYLWFKANFLSTGSYTMPSGPSLVQLSPHTGMYSIGLEDISPSAQMVNYTNSQHISGHPMTTIAIGSAQQTGKIRVGANGPIDIGSKNIILLTTPDDVRDLSRIMTTGIVATSGFVASVDGEPAVFVTPRLDNILVDPDDEEEEVKRRKRRKVEKTDNDHNMCVAL